ncbi:MAG: hypothetical protein ACTSUE_21940 [Promethearchaeota archaeon]
MERTFTLEIPVFPCRRDGFLPVLGWLLKEKCFKLDRAPVN